ncbi:hypothetical protein [Halorubrum depositum]|uniref:hypothetical protein n=1 Tax=Halorubrum depositum TaxID=2583992 RepID=UPI0011A06053|nr:hypothetical protein [Halorubrum depositum]
MSSDPESEAPAKGDEYALPNGSTEIVFHVEGGHVLTVREYESVDAFEESVSRGRYMGTREDVLSIPDPEEFADPESTPGGEE